MWCHSSCLGQDRAQTGRLVAHGTTDSWNRATHVTEPFTAEAVPIFLPRNLGLLQLLPSHTLPVLPAQSLYRLCSQSQCQDLGAGEGQRFHCLFANGGGD